MLSTAYSLFLFLVAELFSFSGVLHVTRSIFVPPLPLLLSSACVCLCVCVFVCLCVCVCLYLYLCLSVDVLCLCVFFVYFVGRSSLAGELEENHEVCGEGTAFFSAVPALPPRRWPHQGKF